MKKLSQTLSSIIGNRPTVIMAGHFPLFLERLSNTLIPGIPQDCQQYPELQHQLLHHPYVAQFPSRTFDMGLDIWKTGDQFCFFVNDWAFVPKSENKEMESRKSDFYKNYTTLPNLFLQKSASKNIDIYQNLFAPTSKSETYFDNPLYFSETKFRNEFINKSKRSGVYSSCKLGSSCAQEFLPILLNLQSRGVKTFTVFIPMTCKEATNEAIQTGIRDFGLTMEVISVIPDHVYSQDAENFFKKCWVFVNGEYFDIID